MPTRPVPRAGSTLQDERLARTAAEADRDILAAVLERITDAFFALDSEWRFTYVNDQAERLLLRTREELLGRGIWDEFPQAVGSTFEREYRRARQDGVMAEFQEFYPPLDAWFEVRAYPAADGLSVFFRDVTVQRATAAALETSERRLRLAMDAAQLGSFEWDIGSGRIYWSPAIERMHGIAEGSFEGTFEAYQRDMHPDDRDRVLGQVQRALAAGDAHHLDYRIVRPDGEVRWLEAHGHFERDEAGRPTRLMGVCRDVTARVAMEHSSRFRRYLLELVTANATSALFLMDRNGHPTFMNAAAERMTGFMLEEIRDRPLHYAVHHHHPDGSPYPLEECPIDRALPQNNDLRAHEDVFIRKDGTFFPVVCAASPIIEDGAPVGTVVEVRDVTDERAARERLRVLTEAIPVQVWTAMPDGALDFVTARAGDYFGAALDTLLGDGWTRFVHGDDLPSAAARWQASLASGTPYETEFRLRRTDGTWRWHLARALPQRDVTGQVTGWFGTNTDIEDQKEAERLRDQALVEVRSSREGLHRALEQIPAAVSITEGPEHVIVFQNATSRAMIGGRNLIGRKARETLPELEEQGYFDLVDRIYASGEPWSGRELPVRWDPLGDGNFRESFFDSAYQPLRDATGAIYGLLSYSADVTHQVLARRDVESRAEEMRRLASLLEQSNQELDQFAYVTSHDLKAPLRGIANLTQWIEEDLGSRLTDESREHMRLLKGRVHRMESLIDGILTYARAGRLKVRPERVDTGEVVQEVIDLLGGPEVHFEIAPDLPTIIVERVPLQQVFLNLLGNAVKFTRAYGTAPVVRVGWRDVGSLVEFAVDDNGPGIAPEFHDRVWGIFQTLHPRDRVEGTGIGLSVVKKIVESRGGGVRLTSESGHGATFSFFLPKVAHAVTA